MLEAEHQNETRDGRVREEDIVDRIYEAVIDQRLPPGTKLSESALCDAFGVGRMRIRRSLLLLASREIVDLQSNRGAYVSSPTPEQAREVFEARCLVEPNVARLAVERARPQDIKDLKRHLDLEGTAHREGNRREVIRLSGLFHVKLAAVAGNASMARMVKELVTRTSLIIGMFGAPGRVNCADEEHPQLLNAIEQGDQDGIARLMTAHLEHIEAQLDLSVDGKAAVDLVDLFKKD